ncbi:hypothetical protein [Siminovitchia fortis]|uniref:hypothetical protein n=1 Tax=Siminovitchia fortis TaxID=254758 RepID=UPI0016434A08|nr:hypothetical protein [Siminovitchia fortis]
MAAIEKELVEVNEWGHEEEYVVNDMRKIDHWLLFGIGILPLLVSSIWYYMVY